MGVSSNYIFAALLLAAVVICLGKPPETEDIGTNFFLKASKSVPRIGRRTMEYENYFLKASKSIPRIGRRTLTSSAQSDNEGSWFSKTNMEDPVKRSFFEKYLKENEQPVWNDLDYPGIFQEETYPEAGINSKLDPYRPRTKKNEKILETRQNHEK